MDIAWIIRILRYSGSRMIAAGLTVAMLTLAAQSPAVAQVIVMVNGEPITAFDVEQRSKLIQLTTHKTPSRQDVVNELINEKVKVNVAKLYTLVITDKEVNNSFNTMAERMHMSAQQLTQALASSGVDARTLKARIKADMTWNQLVRGKFQASLQVGEKDVLNELKATNKDDTNAVGYEYNLRPILFIVPKGAPASAFEARKREAEGLRTRFQSCDEGIAAARTLRDVAVRDPISRASADLPSQFRDILNKTEIGHLTAPDITQQGVELFALCERRQTDDTPAKRAAREEIMSRRFVKESERFLKEQRARAMIEYK